MFLKNIFQLFELFLEWLKTDFISGMVGEMFLLNHTIQ